MQINSEVMSPVQAEEAVQCEALALTNDQQAETVRENSLSGALAGRWARRLPARLTTLGDHLTN